VEHTFEHIGRKVMLLNARRLRRGPGEREMILLAIEDATARRDAEEARRETETRFAVAPCVILGVLLGCRRRFFAGWRVLRLRHRRPDQSVLDSAGIPWPPRGGGGGAGNDLRG
jgi:hypothetical protein